MLDYRDAGLQRCWITEMLDYRDVGLRRLRIVEICYFMAEDVG